MNVIDSIGFCDSEIEPEDVQDLVQQYLGHRFKDTKVHIDHVVIVCSGRIEHHHTDELQKIMEWLKYDEHKKNFTFVYNKADQARTEAEKAHGVHTLARSLGVSPVQVHYHPSFWRASADPADPATFYRTNEGGTNVLHTGFPPSATSIEDVRTVYNKFVDDVFDIRTRGEYLDIDESWCSIM